MPPKPPGKPREALEKRKETEGPVVGRGREGLSIYKDRRVGPCSTLESWTGLAVCQGTKSENGKWMGEVRRGMRGMADPPSSLRGGMGGRPSTAGKLPALQEVPFVCVWPPAPAAGSNMFSITDRNTEGTAGQLSHQGLGPAGEGG